MKPQFIIFTLLISCCVAQEDRQPTSSLFDQALRYEKLTNNEQAEPKPEEMIELIFGKIKGGGLVPVNMEFFEFIKFLSSSNAWETTSVTNGFRMMGQAPEGFDFTKLCLDIGLDFKDESKDEDLKIVIILDVKMADYSAMKGGDIIMDFKANNLNPKVLQYMLIYKGNGWFFDNRESSPFPK